MSTGLTSEEEVLAHQYQRKTDKQHILDNPDTYIGSVELIDSPMWVFHSESDNNSDPAVATMQLQTPPLLQIPAVVVVASDNRIVLETIQYVPGLYKLFDEGIVNCRDHVLRMIQSTAENKKLVTKIQIDITEDGTISMWNDGNGIDVAKHPTEDLWIPELVFGHLRTSTNYDKTEKKIVGGKNGFGFKLVLIWSVWGQIETVDHIRGLKYVQTFENNLDVIHKPVITSAKRTTPYTRVSFRPDYERLGGYLTPDMIALLRKRAYDIAAVTDKRVKVVYRDWERELVLSNMTFVNYIDLYVGDKTADSGKRVHETTDPRWEYAIALTTTDEFAAISFVNGICTPKGGKHVDYIMSQITRKLAAYIEKRKKITVNQSAIREQLMLFLRCDIENPAFDSQSKDCLNTPSNKFGSSCVVSDAFIEKIAKMGVMDVACSLMEAKESRAAKRTDGTKTRTIRGIPNLIDANFSGTDKSKECTLILCEGLSALSGIVSGLSAEDRNIIGIYPLRGKLLNVRGEAVRKIGENKEITDLKKILGLEQGREYSSMDDVHRLMRYGKVMILCDQDNDGSHIKGLCINLFHCEWASLFRLPGFLSFMNTPILRAKKGSQTRLFYNEGEYRAWKLEGGNHDGWDIKYFKGLGTSTAAEFKEYFANKKIVDFVYTADSSISDDVVDKVFNKKRADDRKTWLKAYNREVFLDTNRPAVAYEEFIDNELIHFSTYDCARSLPHAVDGLKISQRKILFSAFKRRLTHEIKVAQFSGYVSEHSAYHHGEQSLNEAIVNMAQDFVGSNNIALLQPNGQFGTRLNGGDDSASERYIFTLLSPLARYLFPAADDAVLNFLDDDGTSVEPEYYAPILPFALINGISGIGTGFSCSIPSFNPLAIVAYLRHRLTLGAFPTGDSDITFVPFYEGFRGTVSPIADDANKFLVRGVFARVPNSDDKIHITELPVGTWTMPYTTYLETLADGIVDKQGKRAPAVIRDFISMSTEKRVDITVTFPRGRLAELSDADVEKILRLTSTLSISNMHLFNGDSRLHKFASVQEIIHEFFGVRMAMYVKRKEYQLADLRHQLARLTNRARFIQLTLDGNLDLRKKSATEVTELLSRNGFDAMSTSSTAPVEDRDFKYLTKLPMDSVTAENVRKIMDERDDAERAFSKLMGTSVEKLWLGELETFSDNYFIYKEHREQLQQTTSAANNNKPPSKSSNSSNKRTASDSATTTTSTVTAKKRASPFSVPGNSIV